MAVLILLIFLLRLSCSANDKVDKMVRPAVRIGLQDNGAGTVIRAWEHDGGYAAFVLTAAHVVKKMDRDRIPVHYLNFNRRGKITSNESWYGRLKEYDEKYDFAIILTNTKKLRHTASSFRKREDIPICLFDKVYVVGCPSHERIWVSSGMVSSLNPTQLPDYIGHSGMTSYGTSGGAVYTENGILVGLVSQFAVTKEESPLNYIGFASPIEKIKETLGDEKTQLYFGDEITK